MTTFQEGHFEYFKNIGIDLRNLEHPVADEFSAVQKLNNPVLTSCFENVILMLALDFETIKKYSPVDHSNYVVKMNARGTSFWGQRFEISWYARLISMTNEITNLRKGVDGHEADFIFDFENAALSMEITSAMFEFDSLMVDPILKLKRLINRKDKKKYANDACCLVVDYSNLSFYRKIKQNFSISISELIPQLQSKFGMILFQESFHISDGSNIRLVSEVRECESPTVNESLRKFYRYYAKPSDNSGNNKIQFRVG